LEYLSIDWRIILKRLYKKHEGRAWTEFIWLRIGTGRGALVSAVMNLRVP
jgi:hypothetical protein